MYVIHEVEFFLLMDVSQVFRFLLMELAFGRLDLHA